MPVGDSSASLLRVGAGLLVSVSVLGYGTGGANAGSGGETAVATGAWAWGCGGAGGEFFTNQLETSLAVLQQLNAWLTKCTG